MTRLNDPKNEECVHLPETLSFLTVRVLVYHLPSSVILGIRQPILPLATGYSWSLLPKTTTGTTGCLYPPFVQAESSYSRYRGK